MDINGDQRLLFDLQEMSNTVTESVASAFGGADIENNSVYSYDISSTNLLYWSGDGGGGGGGGVGNGGGTVGGVGNPAALSMMSSIGAASLNGAGDIIIGENVAYIDMDNVTQSPLNANGTAEHIYQQLMEPCQAFDPNSNLTYWNLTCDAPLEYVGPLYGYCMPFLFIITIVANSLIVLVLSKKNMATPTNFVLMGMAICDMLTVLFPAPGFWYMYTFGNHYKPLHPVSLCLMYSIFNEILPAMCHTASIWLTLALAVQRYIYVCHAPMARTWCTMPRVRRCTIYIAIGAFLHQSTRFFDRTYYPLIIEWNGGTTEVCHVETSPWVHKYIGEDVYFTYYFLFRVLFVHLLPCITLVTLNILLFGAMQRAQERRKLLFRENRKKECKKLRESNCTTLMLIVVVTVFLIVEIPIAVVTAMHIVSSLTISFLDYRIANIFITFTNFFLVVSYPINFGIYCGMSRQFRETFKEIFLGRMPVKKDNSSKYSIVNGPRTCTNTNTNETVL